MAGIGRGSSSSSDGDGGGGGGGDSSGGGVCGGSSAHHHEQVVVKVCHPNVARHIRLDFLLLRGLSAAASRLPLLRGLSIQESVLQFSHTMTAQVDLRVEAVHALRFYNNFMGKKLLCVGWGGVGQWGRGDVIMMDDDER
jgi:hypothetical protein